MPRFPVSSTNTVVISAATASDNVAVHSITSGRVFWLRGLTVATNASSGPLLLIDTTAATATGQKVTILLATATAATPASGGNTIALGNQTLNFDPPGIKFTAGVYAKVGGAETVPKNELTVWGYEEG